MAIDLPLTEEDFDNLPSTSLKKGQLLNNHISSNDQLLSPCDIKGFDSLPAVKGVGVTTRSGRTTGKAVGLHGVKEGRIERNKTKRDAFARLTKALSEIATEHPHLPVNDASSFAHRSIGERRNAATVDGKIKRPLNAFMLYRKTYQEVAKTQCSKNNHQHVSTVCGTSWRELEPVSVRRRFEQLAQVEKEMHAEAHPGYKYIPVSCRKSRPGAGLDSASATGTSDIDEDYGNRRQDRTSRRKRTPKRQRARNTRSPAYDAYTPEAHHSGAMGPDPGSGGGIWLTPNPSQNSCVEGQPHGALPIMYGSPGFHGYEHQMGMSTQGFTYPEPSINNQMRPMVSSNDPYFPGYGMPNVQWNNLPPNMSFPDPQTSWQPQPFTSPVPQWSMPGTDHDQYLADGTGWVVEDVTKQVGELFNGL
ncbi:hypothetical protein S40285_08558 [Stachybotrys chlorohalonatus IBT 40285]|uniref:HMG box domain-containing protein n=1 Tax=Stachybotrys chlorohalonatus (strain IBT 40285) TaxID=1283841 RepID=A0A084Q7R5_STAC4|nr:hypothetical protein S40285_08558 [Stachybotrys chlorohalonata IBT 40285]